MREYELVIDQALKNGLSPNSPIPFNSQVLSKCLGFRCGKVGLESYKELINPLPVEVEMYYLWPFPKMFIGELYNILVIRDDFDGEDIVYEVSDDNTVATQIAVIPKLIYGQGTMMEIADFGEYIFMTNGVVMIYYNPASSSWIIITSHDNIPMMRTICNFKGRVVGGNIVSSWYDCDETFYVWSNIGDIDFTLGIKNTSGYRRCPYGGEVMHVMRLGDDVIGYSDKGITLIHPVTTPIPTFGFKELYDKGIINRGALDGNLQSHLFVDEDYNIVKIITGKDPEVIGYQSFMLELADEDIIVNYDRKEGDYYIGNSTKTFLLSLNGLTEIQQHPSTIWRRDKESYIIPDTVDDFEPEIISSIFNMEFSGDKTIATMETDAVLHDGAEAGVGWAISLNAWGTGDYIPMNNMGISSITASANFFKFKLKFSSIEELFNISYIKARYKMTDLRGIRGVYAPPIRGQR